MRARVEKVDVLGWNKSEEECPTKEADQSQCIRIGIDCVGVVLPDITYMQLKLLIMLGKGQGPWGHTFVLMDWQVGVFGKSGILDRMSEHLSVRTITMQGCMNR